MGYFLKKKKKTKKTTQTLINRFPTAVNTNQIRDKL